MANEQTRNKAKNGAGTVERRRDAAGESTWWARVALPRAAGEPLRRKRVPIPNSQHMSEAQARREGVTIAEDVKEGRIVFDVDVAPPPTSDAITTVRQLGIAWTSGTLLKTYGKVNKLRVKAGAQIDAWCLKANAYEMKTRGPNSVAFGDLRLVDVTEDDIAKVMASQPHEHRAETLIKQYNRLHRMFDLAIFPLRARKDNPVTRYLRPQPDAEKLFCFLYPVEVLALLRGRNQAGEVVIPLGRRVLYAVAVYTGQRKGSLLALKWKHADFEHGTLASFRTKTGRAQYFVADRG